MENNRYELIIRIKGIDGTGQQSPVANSSGGDTAQESDGVGPLITKAKAVAVYRRTKAFAQQVYSHHVSTISLRTGASEYQQKMQFHYQIASDTFGILDSIALGAIMGGGVPGAVVGAVVGVASKAINYAQAQNTIDLNRAVESETVMLNNVRAGTANRRVNY